MNLVNTIAGEIPDSDLVFTTLETENADSVVMSREWKYKGADPALAKHVGQVVRRDCWVTMKTGVSLSGVAEL